jgi:cysteine-rich repeat protein
MLGLGLALLLGASSAGAGVTKYGLGHVDDLDFRKHPSNDRPPSADAPDDFGGSYFFLRSSRTPGSLECGIDREYTPILGQVFIEDEDGCTPTSTGPTCIGGTSPGAMCHLPLGVNSAPNTVECGAGGTCEIAAGTSCAVAIPLTDQATPVAERTRFVAPIWAKLPPTGGLLDLLSNSPAHLSASASADPADDCRPEYIRSVPNQGRRYLLPASRGGDGVKTFIRWNQDNATGLQRLLVEGTLCCNSTATVCDLPNVGPFFEYPILNTTTCEDFNPSNPGVVLFKQTPDWIFAGGAGTAFGMDSEFVVPGQQVGVCRANRDRPCDTLTPHLPQAVDCATLDADPVQDGIQPDSCDFREPGMRSSRPFNEPDGDPNVAACGNSMYVFRGTPDQYCHIIEEYAENGDPGPDCDVLNFGARTRADLDCDGIVDDPDDKCPLLNEFDHRLDRDGDCGDPADPDYPLPGCRGDECECGDQNLDGHVDVTDLPAINIAIFNPPLAQEICDTNLDDLCNVSDILGASTEIFRPGSSVCSHVTTVNCGNGFLDGSEECDDGDRFSGDGCSAICRVETGWQCTGEPSVCTPL